MKKQKRAKVWMIITSKVKGNKIWKKNGIPADFCAEMIYDKIHDPIKQQLNNFILRGLTLETPEAYFDDDPKAELIPVKPRVRRRLNSTEKKSNIDDGECKRDESKRKGAKIYTGTLQLNDEADPDGELLIPADVALKSKEILKLEYLESVVCFLYVTKLHLYYIRFCFSIL